GCVVRRRPVALIDLAWWLAQITAAGELHLQRMYALCRAPVMARGVATLEAAIGDAAEGAAIPQLLDGVCQPRGAARAREGADVEIRQHAGEQARDLRTDRMAIVEDDGAVAGTQPRDLLAHGAMIGLEPGAATRRDVRRGGQRAAAVEQLTVERRGGAQL